MSRPYLEAPPPKRQGSKNGNGHELPTVDWRAAAGMALAHPGEWVVMAEGTFQPDISAKTINYKSRVERRLGITLETTTRTFRGGFVKGYVRVPA